MKNKNKQNTQNRKETFRTRLLQFAMYLTAIMGMFMYGGFYSNAANLGEKAAKWGLDQLFWLGIVAIGIVVIMCLVKRAWIQAFVVLIVGGVLLYVIKTPDVLTKIGESIGNQIFSD